MEQEEDIVERLRRNDLSDNASGVPCVLCREAADEIERLRAEHAEDVHSNLKLHDIVEGWHNKHDPSTLVERAKAMSGIDGDTHLCWEAADEIERQADEIFHANIERSKLETALKVADDLLRETRESLARVTAKSCSDLLEAQAEIERLRGALKGMTARYCELVNSGDCGFWNPEEEDEVKHARSALGEQRGRWPMIAMEVYDKAKKDGII